MKISSLFRGLTLAAFVAVSGSQALAAGGGATPLRVDWSFAGVFGRYDKAQLQRGFNVFKTVCANCHGLNMPIRMLAAEGGPGFTEDQVKAIASEYKVADLNDAGETIERAAKLTDNFPAPYANVQAAIATHGAYPPNFQVLAKARTYTRGFPYWVTDMLPGLAYQENGADYIYSLIAHGYVDAPAEFQVPDGANYNTYMPGNVIKMAAPLSDGVVTYPRFNADGTVSEDPAQGQLAPGVSETVDQYAKDVVAFMYWAAEPHLEERKRIGFQVILFLAVFAVLLFYTKKRVWSRGGAH